jgi:hypothetical protein
MKKYQHEYRDKAIIRDLNAHYIHISIEIEKKKKNVKAKTDV